MKYEAAIFEGPPALEKTIRDWMFSIYAGHVLAQVEEQIAKAQDARAPYIKAIRELVEAQRILSTVKDMEGGDSIRFSTPRLNSRGRIDPWFTGIKNTNAPPDARYRFTTNQPYQVGYGEKNVSYSRSQFKDLEEVLKTVGDEIETSLDIAHYVIDNWKDRPDPSADSTLVEKALLRAECRKYTTKAKAYTSKAVSEFPVDIDGWKFAGKGGPLIADENKKREKRNQEIDSAVRAGEYDLKVAQELFDRATAGEEIPLEVWRKHDYNAMNKYWTAQQIQLVIRAGKRPATAWAQIPNLLSHYGPKMVRLEDIPAERQPLLTAADIKKVLVDRGWSKISTILWFIDHTERGGQWSFGSKQLEVDVRDRTPKTVKDFLMELLHIKQVVRHEVQHVGQDLLRTMALLKEDAGLPSKDIRTPGVDPNGVPVGQSKRVDHALRDVEFMTDLADAIEKFMNVVHKFPVNERADAVRAYVGLSHKPMKVYPQPSWEFGAWKKKAPDKWRKGVSEFVKALHERGVDLGGALRVAMCYEATSACSPDTARQPRESG